MVDALLGGYGVGDVACQAVGQFCADICEMGDV